MNNHKNILSYACYVIQSTNLTLSNGYISSSRSSISNISSSCGATVFVQ